MLRNLLKSIWLLISWEGRDFMGLNSVLQSKKMKTTDMILLTTSLSYMSDAGLTFREGVDILMSDPNGKINRYGLQLLKDCFDEGLVLSQAFHEHENVYGTGLWRQIDAAERTGKVAEALLRISEQLKSSQGVMSKVRGAMAYPLFILCVALFAGYFLFTTTIPEMGNMMLEFGAELPALTMFVMAACDAMVDYGPLVLLGLALSVATTVWALSHPFKLWWHRFVYNFPLSGGISTNMNYSRVYTLINDMIENGSNMVDSVRVAASAVSNLYISSELLGCADDMEREGKGLADALAGASTMPSNDRLMLNVGNRTGREKEILMDMAKRREAAANESVDRLLELLTPIIMLLVCAVVGVLVVSVYMPMLTMASAM